MGIGTLAERSLHASLKERFSRPGDKVEERVDGYVIDIVRDGTLIEIQTGGFSRFKAKLANLLPRHPVHVIFPFVASRECVALDAGGKCISRRSAGGSSTPSARWRRFRSSSWTPTSPSRLSSCGRN